MAIDGSKPLSINDLLTESERSKQLWFREYMGMGRFSTGYMREANILADAAQHALKLLSEINGVSEVRNVLKEGTRTASAIRLESVQPQTAPKEVRKAFLWIAEKEGMNTGASSEGLFHSPNTQRAWDMFQRGATWAEKRMAQPEVEAEQPKKRWLA
jgi:hypothetical protein